MLGFLRKLVQTTKDARSNPRYRVTLWASVLTEDGWRETLIRDVSQGGLCLSTFYKPRLNEEFLLKTKLPTSDTEATELTVRMVYHYPDMNPDGSAKPSRYGTKLVSADEESRERWRAFVESLERQDAKAA